MPQALNAPRRHRRLHRKYSERVNGRAREYIIESQLTLPCDRSNVVHLIFDRWVTFGEDCGEYASQHGSQVSVEYVLDMSIIKGADFGQQGSPPRSWVCHTADGSRAG